MIEIKEKNWNAEKDLGWENLRNELVKEPDSGTKPVADLEADFFTLFDDNEADQFRAHWLEIQSHFVDGPFNSVREANELISHVFESITESINDKRMTLEDRWLSGDMVSTEELRVVLKQYRNFLNSLLALRS